jgi:hypothetical protein
MKKQVTDELLQCPRCGMWLGIGKYRPLSRPGNPRDCTADMRYVPTEEADRLLDEARRQP